MMGDRAPRIGSANHHRTRQLRLSSSSQLIPLSLRRQFSTLFRFLASRLDPQSYVGLHLTVSLVLAGHTHCGQIILPLVGALESGSDYGTRFLCGIHRNGSRLLVVTAGLGTSHVPLRIGAPADIWLITVQGRLHNSGRPLLPPNS